MEELSLKYTESLFYFIFQKASLLPENGFTTKLKKEKGKKFDLEITK